jgi:ABC-type transport system involved in multi-copper enzyme maturation permease subunit
MSSISQESPTYASFTPKRSDTVVMGRQDFISVVLRSIGAELYKLRRQAMPKVLLLIAMLILFVTFAVPTLIARNLSHDTCTIIDRHGQGYCRPQSPAEIQQYKETASASLRLPDSLPLAVGVINFVGMLSLMILTSSIVGGEYGIGTIRFMLTRGPTRTQLLLAKIGVIIICTLTMFLVLILFSVIVGALFNLTTGVAFDFSFFTGIWLLHAIFYVLTAAFGLFTYEMLALCLATLGQKAAAGIAGALIWWVLEGVLRPILFVIGERNKGPVGNFLQSIPNYFIGNSTSTLLGDQQSLIVGGQTSSMADVRAIIVLVTYLVVFIGVAWWAQRRDIAN